MTYQDENGNIQSGEWQATLFPVPSGSGQDHRGVFMISGEYPSNDNTLIVMKELVLIIFGAFNIIMWR